MRILRHLDPDGAIAFAQVHADGAAEACAGDPFAGLRPLGRPARIARTLSPVAPPLILGIGLNYRRHAEETGAKLPSHPVVFMKAPGALNHPGAPIVLPACSTMVDYECELAVVLARTCRDVARTDALGQVLGYTVANDVSARDWQKQWGGGQWCRGKSFDGFCPLGPVLVTADAIPDPQTLRLTTAIGEDRLQDSTTADMIFAVADLIAFLSQGTTLPAGTVILTGTPEGVGMARTPPRWLRAGETVRTAIAGIGELANPVVAA